jgi:hypothetical protein
MSARKPQDDLDLKIILRYLHGKSNPSGLASVDEFLTKLGDACSNGRDNKEDFSGLSRYISDETHYQIVRRGEFYWDRDSGRFLNIMDEKTMPREMYMAVRARVIFAVVSKAIEHFSPGKVNNWYFRDSLEEMLQHKQV